MPEFDESAIARALHVAFRHFDDRETSDAERDSILATMALLLHGKEGETAARALHHRREAAQLQMELRSIVNPPTS